MGLTSGPGPNDYWFEFYSFMNGIIMPFMLSNFFFCIKQYRTTKKKVNLALAVISIWWFVFQYIWNFFQKYFLYMPGPNGRPRLQPLGAFNWHFIYLSDPLLHGGFTMVNTVRGYTLLSKEYGKKKLAFLFVVAIILWANMWGVGISWCVIAMRIYESATMNRDMRAYMPIVNRWQGWNYAVDTVYNALLSLTFVWYLQKLNSRSGVSMRPGLARLLRVTQVELVIEALLTITADIIMAEYNVDNGGTVLTVQAIRIRILADFIYCLNETFKQQASRSDSQVSSNGKETRASNASSFKKLMTRAISGRSERPRGESGVQDSRPRTESAMSASGYGGQSSVGGQSSNVH